MKTAFIKRSIDASRFVNMDTGEAMIESYPNITSVNEKSDLAAITYEEYVVIDSKAIAFIREVFNEAETGRILAMADMVRGCYNVLFNKKTSQPHVNETLSEELEYSRNKFDDFMKKLFNKSVIYYIRGIKDGKERVLIMLNPTLARKSKFFHKDCRSVFEDLSRK